MIRRKDPEDEKADRERARLKADGDAYVAWVRARTLWTSGSETRAEIAVQDARHDVASGGPGFTEWRRLVQANMSLGGMLDRLATSATRTSRRIGAAGAAALDEVTRLSISSAVRVLSDAVGAENVKGAGALLVYLAKFAERVVDDGSDASVDQPTADPNRTDGSR
jgi:hypothetical protein